MAQHDYNIANQSGADFRADLNNALSAIATVNSGASEPSTTFAHQLWVDTSNNVLKIRNAANSAFITTGVSITASNTFAGNLTGNADTATTLATARTINGVSFNGSANISFNTDSVAEGSSNLYFTNERVDDQVNALLQAGTGIQLTYDDTAGTLTIANTNDADITGVVAGNGLTGGGTAGSVTLNVAVDDSSIEIDSDALRVKASGITNTMLAGSIANSKLANSGVTINSQSLALGGTLVLDTDNIGEGSSNLYYTTARVNSAFDTRLATKDTGDLSEGSNLYFTNERVDDRVSTLIQNGTGISWSYDDTAGTFTPTISLSPFNTSQLSESGNLYFTDARARAAISENSAQLSYNSTTGVLTYTQGDTDTVSEGSNNLYYTSARANTDFDTRLATKSTSNLAEGTNLYYTTARFDSAFTSKDTDDLSEGTTNLYYTQARFDSAFGNKTTANLTENTNLYYTDTRANSAIDARVVKSFVDALGIQATSVADNSVVLGNDTTGNYIQTITGTANKITVSGSGSESADVTLTLPDDVQIASDLTVAGNLTVNGTLTSLDTTNLDIEDNLFQLNAGLTGSPVNDSGMLINRGNQNNGIFMWDESVDKFTLGLTTADGSATGNITLSSLGTLVANLEGSVTGNITGQVSDISNFTTANLTENTNLYYTQARFDSAFTAKSTSDLSEGSNLYYTDARFDTRLASKDTDDVSEGTSNLYYTSTRFNSAFSGKSTSSLSEGSNLYYTDARVQAVSINNVVEDTTPQLGGNLDLNSSDITGTGDINITGTIQSSGNITGTLATAAQPNITSVGTLTGFTSTGIDDNADATAITIDSSENVLVGKNETTFSTEGIVAFSSADSYGSRINITNDGGGTLNLNRKTSDGDIAIFYKDSTTVGSIGTANSGDLYIGNDDTTLLFAGGSDAILPRGTAGAARDGAISLGLSSHRFNNLHLSGTANVGSVSSGSASSASEIIATSLDNGTSFGSNRMLKLVGTSTTDNSRMGIHFTGNTGVGNGLGIIEAVNEDQSAGHTSLRMHTYSGSWNENNLVLKSGNVGIGENNPDASIHITSNTPVISFDESDAGQEFRIGSFGGAFALYDSTDSAYRLIVDGSGNLLVGKTSSAFNTAGVQLQSNGELYATRDGGTVVSINRKSSDGAIVNFAKDGSTVGSIGAASGDLHIDGLANHSGIRFQAGSLLPRLNGSDTNGTIDLGYDDGSSIHRFRNLFLSGGVSVIGTTPFLMVQDTDTNNSGVMEQAGTDLFYGNSSSSGTHIFKNNSSNGGRPSVNGNELMRIDSAGKVGIGNSSPTAKLTIDNSIATTYSTTGYGGTPANSMIYLNNTHGGSNTASLINFRTGSGDGVIGFVEGGGTNDADFVIQTDGGSNGVERLRITNSGNVAIGSTSDALDNMSGLFRILDSTGGDRTVAHFGAHNYGDTGKTFINIGTEYGDGTSRIGSFNDTSNSSVLVFDTHSATSGQFTERMRIDSAGHVGIAQDTPSDFNAGADDLVIGNSGGDFGITIRTGTSNTGNIFFADGITGNQQYRGAIQYLHSSDAMVFGTDGGTERMRIDSSGNVTKPTQCNFLARRNGNQTGYNASGSYGDGVRYNSEIYDIGGDFDVTTGIFTAPVDGTYFIQGSAYSNTTGTNWSQAWLAINGARANYTDMVAADGDTFISTTHLVKLSAGDEVRYHPYYSGSTSVTILDNANHTWFKGYLLG